MITKDSKIREIYSSPVGHDILNKILMQIGLNEKVLTNPLVGNLKLKNIIPLTKKILSPNFFDTFISLLNSEKDMPAFGNDPINPAWWKEAIFYQIYPRSFADSDGDGFGDIRGIIDKLDYLQELGITALWLSPIYDSPQDDNGYDIRDYQKIYEQFGTMEDFDELLDKTHQRGMKLIMDLVINHTSDEHRWFQEALENPDSPYRDYYFFRKAPKDTPPTNWTSFFAGSAWNYYEKEEIWALHLFSKKQMDLNWENPSLRKDVIDMVNWWLEKGVDGFRMDVINYISKQPGLPQGDTTVGALMGYTGIEHYFYGPRLHEFLRQIRKEAFDPHDAFSVGETPGMGMNMCKLLTGEERKELDMVFSFDHLETPGHVRFDDYLYDLNYLRDYFIDWMENYGNNCWFSIFYNNHDNPRMISKINPDPVYAKPLAFLLAAIQFTMRGTPFLYQGDEMGLVNYPFQSMEEITDVEAKGYYQEMLEKKSPEEAFASILAGTREHTRLLLPWNEATAGYPSHLQQLPDKDVMNAYKQLIQLRKQDKTLVYGDFSVISRKKNRFVYCRKGASEYLIDCNLCNKNIPAWKTDQTYQLICSTGSFMKKGEFMQDENTLAPYEVRIWKKR